MVLLVIFGMTLLARLQVWTQPLWLILLFGPFLAVAVTHPSSFAAFTYFGGNSPSGSAFTLVGTGAGAGVTLSLIAQIGEQADYLRFMPGRTSWNAKGRRTAVLAAAPGGTLSPLVLNGDALAMCPGLLGDWDSVGKAFDGGAYLNRIGVSTRADRLEDAGPAADVRDPVVRRRVFTYTVASDAPLPDVATLDAIVRSEERAGRTGPYRHVAALLHLITVQRACAKITRRFFGPDALCAGGPSRRVIPEQAQRKETPVS